MLNVKTHEMGVGPDLPLDERHLAFVETLPPSAVFPRRRGECLALAYQEFKR